MSRPDVVLLAAIAALAAVTVLAAGAGDAAAQVIQGYVVDDSTEAALPDAVVTVMVDSVPQDRMTTDTTGFFRFTLPDSAMVRLEGERLGWRTVLSQPLHIAAGDTVEVELWMGVHAVPVAPLYVTARSNRGRSRFHRHMEEWSEGVFITPAMVDSIDPIHPVEVLRGQEKTWLSWTEGARGPVPNIRSYLGHGCVKFMVDGMEVRSRSETGPRSVAGADAFERSILETLDGQEIVAAEYYRYPGEVPPELRRYVDLEGEAGMVRMCGLVVYWTESGW